jgi:hypothetical protein
VDLLEKYLVPGIAACNPSAFIHCQERAGYQESVQFINNVLRGQWFLEAEPYHFPWEVAICVIKTGSGECIQINSWRNIREVSLIWETHIGKRQDIVILNRGFSCRGRLRGIIAGLLRLEERFDLG